jgi:hypothetical protein
LTDRGFTIDLPISERWQVVDVLRTAVYQCLAVVFDADSFAEVVSMVVGELVENALKYGAWNGAAEPKGTEARLRISGRPAGVEIEVKNPLPAGANTALLFTMLERIKAAPSPQEAYVERLREVARDATASSGLGLMRIAYEAGCNLSASVEGSTICVKALVDMPPDAAAVATPH